METHKLEYTLSKILAGYIRYRHKDLEVRTYSPTFDILYEAQEVYSDTYDKCVRLGIMDDDDVYNLLVINGLWTDKDEETLNETLPKHIEQFQKEMYQASINRGNDVKTIRKYLAKAREEQLRLFSIRNRYMNFTVAGTAATCKNQYAIMYSTFTKDGKLYDWDEISFRKVVDHYNLNAILPDEIRDVSHNLPWSNYWTAGKANNQVFGKPGVELTSSQQLLLMWSKMYDNIQESTDCPPEFVIDDDDLLDGWLLIQNDKRKKDKDQQFAGDLVSKNEKIANANEVFVVAQTPEDIERIESLNSERAKRVKQARMKHIKTKGEVKHQEFADVQQERMMDMTQAYTQHMRSKKG